MHDEAFKKAVYEACLKAVTTLGPRVKDMSCFLRNWRDTGALPEKEKQAA